MTSDQARRIAYHHKSIFELLPFGHGDIILHLNAAKYWNHEAARLEQEEKKNAKASG